MQNDLIDFDDILDESIEFDLAEIVTPGGIDRRVKSLNDAWLQLVSDSNDKYVKSEFKKWTAWANDILNSSWFTKTWATGILAELDEWKARYAAAYKRVKSNAPEPSTLTLGGIPPYVWIVAGLGLAAGIYFYAQYKK